MIKKQSLSIKFSVERYAVDNCPTCYVNNEKKCYFLIDHGHIKYCGACHGKEIHMKNDSKMYVPNYDCPLWKEEEISEMA